MRIAIAAVTAATLVTSSVPAQAFCGFYVNGSNKKMFADATQVILMRSGTRTVLSMKNDYRGPLEDFAMVVPVPVVLKDTDVRVLPRHLFDRVDSLGAPRLVEYWEQDPCPEMWERMPSRPMKKSAPMPSAKSGSIGGAGGGYGAGAGRMAAPEEERKPVPPILASLTCESMPSLTLPMLLSIEHVGSGYGMFLYEYDHVTPVSVSAVSVGGSAWKLARIGGTGLRSSSGAAMRPAPAP
jgi:hypothetical protein